MTSDVYIIKKNTNYFGNYRRVLAFRNILDAQLVNVRAAPQVRTIRKNLHACKKRFSEVTEGRLAACDVDALWYETNINGLELHIVEKVVERPHNVFLISSSYESDREITFIDKKINIGEIYKES